MNNGARRMAAAGSTPLTGWAMRGRIVRTYIIIDDFELNALSRHAGLAPASGNAPVGRRVFTFFMI
jgi:hypothetical protein